MAAEAVAAEAVEEKEVAVEGEPQKQNPRFAAAQGFAQAAAQVAEREAANFDRSSWSSLWNPGRRRSEKIDGRPDYTHSSGGRRNENTPRVIREKTRN